jgi:type IV pilus assembly protein PilA
MVLKKQLKKNRKKGFTLVEVIVVLVILAILAAIAIPALTGYIDKAKDKAIISQTRSTVIAAQTLVTEAASKGVTVDDENVTQYVTSGGIKGLAGDLTIDKVEDIKIENSSIKQLKVTTTDKGTGYYYLGKYDITAPNGFTPAS